MNTFLISNNFQETAAILDNKRLFKQVVEGSQLISVFLRRLSILNDGKKGWLNHPALNIWKDKNNQIYIYQLINYVDQMYFEWTINREYQSSWLIKKEELLKLIDKYSIIFAYKNLTIQWSDETFKVMKSNLIRKKPEYYIKFFGNLEPIDGYLWENCFIKND